MRMKPALTLEDVATLIDICHAKSTELRERGTIAIVDFGGHLLYLERPDHQSPNSVEVATAKARTAAFRERTSASLAERVKEKPGWLRFPNGLPMAGGVPIFYEGVCVGGIGVSGIGDNDEVVAEHAVASFKAVI
jgi:glc operon protein GlcG